MDSNTKQAEWDQFFIGMADYVSTRSKDPSTKVGAVIVRPDGKTIASLGYNGFPRGTSDDPALYNDRPEKYRRVVHAEVNAVLNATSSTEGATVFVTHPPCSQCMALLIQAGVKTVVHPTPDPAMAERFAESFNAARSMAYEADVMIVERL